MAGLRPMTSYATTMAATPEYYAQLVSEDTESLTVLVVAGAAPDLVSTVLGVDPNVEVEDGFVDDEAFCAWAVVGIPGGVLALETTGYGDPSLAALARLSTGGAAAVVRSNVQAHVRFGCARDGKVLFDDDEYMYIDDPSAVPPELRPLFDLVWDDLEGESDEGGLNPVVVGLAMAESITGIELTREHLEQVHSAGFFKAPSLLYTHHDD